MTRVILSNQARRFLDKLNDRKQQLRLIGITESLATNPLPYKEYDLTKMGGMENSYRLRKGDFRIEYAWDDSSRTVYVTAITRRGQAYK